MKRLFYAMTAVFIVLILAGMAASGTYLYRVGKEITPLVDGGISLMQRSTLVDSVTRLRDMTMRSPSSFGRIAGNARSIRESLERCMSCHHREAQIKTIRQIENFLDIIRKRAERGEDTTELVERLDVLSHDALTSGQALVAERSRKAVQSIRIAWLVFVLNAFIVLGVVVITSIFFMKRLDNSIRDIVEATNAVRTGKRINPALFADDFRPIGDAMAMMQTELLVKEEKIMNWARQWQTAFNAVDHMMALCNTEGMVIIANDEFYRVIGGEDSIREKPLPEVVCAGDHFSEQCPIYRTLRDGEIHTAVIRYSGMIINVKTYPITSEDSDISGVLWVGRDVTKEKELEERAVQSEKLVALGELVAGIAHELNNPLTAVVGYSEILKASAGLDDRALEKVDKIYRAALRASKIIRNLLEFARKKSTGFHPHDLNELVDKVLELKDYELRVDNVRVVKNFSDLPRVTCDATQMEQVILNLVNNAHFAISETGEEGTITIRTRADDAYAYIEISDTGPGIPPELIHKVFEPFFTTKDVGKGTGLGLSIVFSAVKAHGGDIRVVSGEGGGATFVVSIPLNADPAA